MINNVFSDCRVYIPRETIKANIGEFYLNIRQLYNIEDKVFYDSEKNSYKVIPYKESVHEYNLNLIEKNETYKLVDALFTSADDISVIVNNYTNEYKDKLKSTKELLKKEKLEPYYGSIEFMVDRSNYIFSCLEEILNSDKLDDTTKKIFVPFYNNAKQLIGKLDINTNDSIDYQDKYLMIEQTYLQVLNVENEASPYMEHIWKSYLTNPENYSEMGEYHFLAHCVSAGHVEEDKLSKVCTTLITDKCSPIPPYGDFGYIMDFSMDQITTMSTEDCGSWVLDKQKFVDDGLITSWQFSEKVDNDNCVFYEYPCVSKLILPWNIEKQMFDNNMNYNGETLGPKATLYSEIFMRRSDKPLKVLAFFAMSDEGLKKIKEINAILDEPKPIIDLRYLYQNKNNYNQIITR